MYTNHVSTHAKVFFSHDSLLCFKIMLKQRNILHITSSFTRNMLYTNCVYLLYNFSLSFFSLSCTCVRACMCTYTEYTYMYIERQAKR